MTALVGDPFLHFDIEVGPAVTHEVAGITRRVIPLLGGQVSGAYAGTVLPGGTDWQTVAPDGRIDIAARYLLQLTEGVVEVESTGLRYTPPDSSEPAYFRTAMRFRTGAAALSHLNRLLAISRGTRLERRVLLTVYPVL